MAQRRNNLKLYYQEFKIDTNKSKFKFKTKTCKKCGKKLYLVHNPKLKYIHMEYLHYNDELPTLPLCRGEDS